MSFPRPHSPIPPSSAESIGSSIFSDSSLSLCSSVSDVANTANIVTETPAAGKEITKSMAEVLGAYGEYIDNTKLRGRSRGVGYSWRELRWTAFAVAASMLAMWLVAIANRGDFCRMTS